MVVVDCGPSMRRIPVVWIANEKESRIKVLLICATFLCFVQQTIFCAAHHLHRHNSSSVGFETGYLFLFI